MIKMKSMRNLIIKNIGAIKSINLELNRVNIFIGPQSSGKSTISKILCYCMWIEKLCAAVNLSEIENYANKLDVYEGLLEFHHMQGYFNNRSSFQYIGELITFKYTHKDEKVSIKLKQNKDFQYPAIGYIPSERNLVAVIDDLATSYKRNDVIKDFTYNWFNSKKLSTEFSLSDILTRDISYIYDSNNNTDYIIDGKSKIKLNDASSGVQSLTPLYKVLLYLLRDIYSKKRQNNYLQDQWIRNQINLEHVSFLNIHKLDKSRGIKRAVKEAFPDIMDYNITIKKRGNEYSMEHSEFDYNRFEYKYTQLFIEEPEQNLFPRAQMKFINELMMMLSSGDMQHSAVVTTHSPYILFEINNAIMRHIVKENISDDMRNELLDNKAVIAPKEISIYQIENGELVRIQDEDGMVRRNYFDDVMKRVMDDYYELLEFFGEDE